MKLTEAEAKIFSEKEIGDMSVADAGEAIDNLARQQMFDADAAVEYYDALRSVLVLYPNLARVWAQPVQY